MRRRLFFTYVAIIVFLTSILGMFFAGIYQKQFTEEFRKRLLAEVNLLSELFHDSLVENGTNGIQEFVSQYGIRLGYRITVLDANGSVLADSQSTLEDLGNHSERQEIIHALEGDIVTVVRKSESTGINFMYAAAPISLYSRQYILRAAVPLDTLESVEKQAFFSVAAVIFIMAVISFFIAYVFAEKISRPLQQLTEAVNSISRGDYGGKLTEAEEQQTDEIAILKKAFNNMSQDLELAMRQKAEENEKLELILNNMRNGVIAVDDSNKILMLNQVSMDLFQIKTGHVAGYNFFDLIKNRKIQAVLERARKEQGPVTEEIMLSANDQELIMKIYANPILKQAGTEIGTILVLQDVTQVRKFEMMRDDFVSNVTHELKTPLTSIIGFADTLKSGAIQDEKMALHFIDIIDIEAERLFRLIQDILSLSEIESCYKEEEKQMCDIEEIIEKVYQVLLPSAQAKRLQLQLSIEEGLPPFSGNEDRIFQLIMNLMDNGIKYTEKGSVTVICKKEKNNLLFIISDTGIGISKEAQKRIFERFYRVDKGRSRKAGGTGLGLSIVKHIVMLYHGTISLASEEGQGSKFFVRLPYNHSSNESNRLI